MPQWTPANPLRIVTGYTHVSACTTRPTPEHPPPGGARGVPEEHPVVLRSILGRKPCRHCALLAWSGGSVAGSWARVPAAQRALRTACGSPQQRCALQGQPLR